MAPFVKRLPSSKSHRHETHERALLGKKLRPETMCASVTSCHSQSAHTLIICLSHIFFFFSSLESDRYRKEIGMRTTLHTHSLLRRHASAGVRHAKSPRYPSAPLTPTSRDGKRNKITTGNYEAVARVRTTRRVFLGRTITVLSPSLQKILANRQTKKKDKEKRNQSNQLMVPAT